MSTLRPDLAIIANWITPDSRVLDLGCGNGTLLAHIQATKNITGYGVEIDLKNVGQCISAGVNVIHRDIDDGLSDFEKDSFDFVIMSQTLQAVNDPVKTLHELLRVGQQAIVAFPNFGHWRCRFDLTLKGTMPVSRTLPNTWYNTPNIHLCTIKDFEALCVQEGFEVVQKAFVDQAHKNHVLTKVMPNLFTEVALYHIKEK